MSAADSVKQSSAQADQKLYEPSMEEILASIRRIIADDQMPPGRLSASEEEDRLRAILAPADPVARQMESAPTVRAIFAPHPVAPEPAAFTEPAHQAAPADRAAPIPTPHHIAAPQYAMPDIPAVTAPEPATPEDFPPATVSAAATEGPSYLGETIEAPIHEMEEEPVSNLFSASTGQSVVSAFNTLAASRLIDNDDVLQDLARDMLRPMLKEWLDDNLPTLVERLVRAEIERVGRGGR